MISWLPHWKQFHEDGLHVFARRQGQSQDYDMQTVWVSDLVFTEYDIGGLPGASRLLFIEIDTNSATKLEYEWQFDILTDVKKYIVILLVKVSLNMEISLQTKRYESAMRWLQSKSLTDVWPSAS